MIMIIIIMFSNDYQPVRLNIYNAWRLTLDNISTIICFINSFHQPF